MSVHSLQLPAFGAGRTDDNWKTAWRLKNRLIGWCDYLFRLFSLSFIDPVLDFQKLVEVRAAVSAALKIPVIDLELSMGMSGDYETALRYGATNVRIGSTIFGART